MNQKFEDAINEIRRNVERFKLIEGRVWGAEGGVIELAKQVGELSALVMNKEGYYFPNRDQLSDKYDSSNDKIADELADILFAVVRIADHYDIDLSVANGQARGDEDSFLKTKGV
jgi:NTP pyrophosphatase (non-canonical NTP hydrolase)